MIKRLSVRDRHVRNSAPPCGIRSITPESKADTVGAEADPLSQPCNLIIYDIVIPPDLAGLVKQNRGPIRLADGLVEVCELESVVLILTQVSHPLHAKWQSWCQGERGVRLLNRTSRTVSQIDAGAALAKRLAVGFTEISGAPTALDQHRDRPSGTLCLNVLSDGARLLFTKFFHPFLEA